MVTKLKLILIYNYQGKNFSSDEKYFYSLEIENQITLKKIYLHLIKKQVNINILKNLKIIHSGDNINKESNLKTDKIINIDSSDKFYIFCNNDDDKETFINLVFENIKIYITESEKENKNLNDSIEYEKTLDKKYVIESNHEVQEILNDSDFINLLKIYTNKPHLFEELSNYVSVKTACDLNQKIKLNQEIEDTSEFETLKAFLASSNLNNNITDSYIKSILKHFDNQINRALRYILTNNSQLSQLSSA